MSSLMRLLNRLLPFATPGTPVYQDVIHLGVLALVLYYAPQIQEHLQQRRRNGTEQVDYRLEHEHENARAGIETDRAPTRNLIRPGGTDNMRGVEEAAEEEEEDQTPPLRNADAAAPAATDAAPPANPIEAAGPANGDAPAPAPAPPPPRPHRTIGAKKAKSLAKKDQRRAYHEFQRSQGEAQRARDQHGAAERHAAHAAELARRQAAEAKLEEKKAREREMRRAGERREREARMASRESIVQIVRDELEGKRMCNLFDVATRVGGEYDEISIEKVLNAANVLGTSEGGAVTMVTSTGWVVRVRREDMAEAYSVVAETCQGDIGHEKLGNALQSVLRSSTG